MFLKDACSSAFWPEMSTNDDGSELQHLFESGKYLSINFLHGIALQGKAAGLIVRMTNNGLGNNEANIFVRGQATGQTATAIVVIDGIERPLNDLLPEEIESIEVLKDAPAKILYGPAAANGVLVVKTKRGVAGKKTLRLSAEMGIMQATRTPKYLDSYRYAGLYNEALEHDGLPALYMPYQLEGYRNSSGENDVLYPNVDWYNYFTDDKAIYRKATFEASGGHKALRYSLVVGYLGGGGFESVGKSTNLNRLNVRGNLDIQVTDYLSVVADAAGRLETSFENHRFFDMRRWVLPLNEPVYGIAVTRDENRVLHYEVQEVEKRKMDDIKYYYLSVPYDERVKNPNLINNLGWN